MWKIKMLGMVGKLWAWWHCEFSILRVQGMIEGFEFESRSLRNVW